MLLTAAAVLAYQDVACADGLYNLRGMYCVTAEQCGGLSSLHYAYAPLRECLAARHSGLDGMQCKDSVCDCREDCYLAVQRVDATMNFARTACFGKQYVNSSLFLVDGTDVRVDEWTCVNTLNMFVLKTAIPSCA